ncbi:MAG: T9SS type A sorting domain-containing protein [Balneolaceae bacterium]
MNKIKILLLLILTFSMAGIAYGSNLSLLPNDTDPERISTFIISFESFENGEILTRRQFTEEATSEEREFYPLNLDNILLREDSPIRTGLLQNYPNPFSPYTNISYTLEKENPIKLELFNSIGTRIATLIDGEQSAGKYNIQFDGSTLSSGNYVYRLQTPSKTYTRHMTLVR